MCHLDNIIHSRMDFAQLDSHIATEERTTPEHKGDQRSMRKKLSQWDWFISMQTKRRFVCCHGGFSFRAKIRWNNWLSLHQRLKCLLFVKVLIGRHIWYFIHTWRARPLGRRKWHHSWSSVEELMISHAISILQANKQKRLLKFIKLKSGMSPTIPQCNFELEFLEKFGQNFIRDHWLITPENSKTMHYCLLFFGNSLHTSL